jgi:rare lipoprotein A
MYQKPQMQRADRRMQNKGWGLFFSILATLIVFFLSGCAGPGRNLGKTTGPVRATTRPYVIKNKVYVPQKHFELVQKGVASYYGVKDGFHGRKTATGETFNAFGLSAAHKTLPLPCVIHITNLDNGKTLVLKVNDRGPFKCNRILDVSEAAARRLGFYNKGTANVQIKTMVAESLRLPENQRGYRRKSSRIKIPSPTSGKNSLYCIAMSPVTLAHATILKTKMKKLGSVMLKKGSKGYRLWIGPYETKAMALAVCRRIPNQYGARVLAQPMRA